MKGTEIIILLLELIFLIGTTLIMAFILRSASVKSL